MKNGPRILKLCEECERNLVEAPTVFCRKCTHRPSILGRKAIRIFYQEQKQSAVVFN